MSEKMNILTKPEIITHDRGAHGAKVSGFVEMKSTNEVSVRVITAIKPLDGVGFEIASVVQYEDKGIWYAKDKHVAFSLPDALKKAYGVTRRLYGTTASRAFAGLLHDSVVPATDDIDF